MRLILPVLLFLAGCKTTAMTKVYQGIGTTALAGSGCIDVLELADDGKHKMAKALKSQGDTDGALQMWDEWGKTYKRVKTACDAALTGALLAKVSAPLVAAAIDRDAQAAAWVVRLLKWASDVTAALSEAGLRLPGGL